MKRIFALFLTALLLGGCAARPAPDTTPSDPAPTAAASAASTQPSSVPEEASGSAPPAEGFVEPASSAEAAAETEPSLDESAEPVEAELPEETVSPAELASARLAEAVAAELDGADGEWSAYVFHRDSGVCAAWQNKPMVAASLIKLYVAGAYYDAVLAGTAADNSRELVRIMLGRSDNDACNRLIDLLGMDAINAFIAREGFADTVLNRRMLEASAQENYTSPRDCVTLLSRVLDGSFVSEEASAEILDALKAQQRTAKLPAGVPDSVKTANKTGELNKTENDAAIFWTDGSTYLICVMSTDLQNTAAARERIVSLSAAVYRFFTTGLEHSGETPTEE